MLRLCCGCLSLRKHKSFPIHEKHYDGEVNKIFIRHVENIRITPPPIIKCQQDKQRIIKKKSIDIEINCNTQLSVKQNNSLDSRIPVSKLFHKSKQLQTSSPSPLPMIVKNISKKYNDKTISNTISSSSSSSTNSDSHRREKTLKSRSWDESFDLSEETTVEKNNISQCKKLSNDIKPLAKSKLVLENVRKMIKEQNIQKKDSI